MRRPPAPDKISLVLPAESRNTTPIRSESNIITSSLLVSPSLLLSMLIACLIEEVIITKKSRLYKTRSSTHRFSNPVIHNKSADIARSDATGPIGRHMSAPHNLTPYLRIVDTLVHLLGCRYSGPSIDGLPSVVSHRSQGRVMACSNVHSGHVLGPHRE